MIPDYQSLMMPVLQEASDKEVSTKDVINILADRYALSEEEREQLLPSGKQRTFDNRVHWAKGYLKQAGLVRYTRRGVYIATDEGRKVLGQEIERIDNNFLKQYDSFQEFQNRKGTQSPGKQDSSEAVEEIDATPDEVLRAAHRQINMSLAADLLDKVRQSSPQFFEDLIIDLLLSMGYGGTSEDAARALGQSGDNGVDGVIDQDPLGVDQIYVQAKRYAEGNMVGAGYIRDFFGALNLKKAQKGIFFTTSSFSLSATQTAKNLGMRIVLIDGQHLAKLMIRYNIGCRDEDILHLKKVDEEFFE
ncbi:restriction endonuclease [Thalassospira xiamenensis]|uniref:Restriction endonuclease n=1 Tax=Thalassospira xiamenensis TaxID=220697 RepID=A0ABR5XXK3_9PROT|nr:restriction endonuclease [Thalassospira xiamenensis]KZC98794.1 restriction endonuclease [Thalassospira xiamenensis]KZD03858.1 restriction endonuclease [Thalassospira xiamenensis]